MDEDLQILNWLYVLSSSVIVIAHFPQIMAVLRAKTGCEEVSLWAWGTWTICMVISTAYFRFVVGDFKAMMVSILVTLCCALVFAITLWKRIRYKSLAHEAQAAGMTPSV